MNEEQKKWQEEFSSNSGGTTEVLRVGCAFIIWHVIGIGLYLWSGNMGYMLIWIAISLSFITLSTRWQPTYSLLRKILGNKNLPPKLITNKSNWWSYISLVITLAIPIFLLVEGVVLLTK